MADKKEETAASKSSETAPQGAASAPQSGTAPAAAQRAAQSDPAAAHAANERNAVHRAASTEAATSVADAVRRVADAAVAEVQRTAPASNQDLDFTFSGSPNGGFVITGPGNFSSSGSVQINGVHADTIAWSTSRIEGRMPAGVTSGEVLVIIDADTVRRGYYKA